MLAQTETVLRPNSQRAIVIGSSIAGLLAARILTDYFDHVVVFERDRIERNTIEHNSPSDSLKSQNPNSQISTPFVFRQGVPQSNQLHVLLTQGQQIMEQLFPGLRDELARRGAPLIDWTQDCRLLFPGGWTPRFSSHISTRACTRNLLETLLRQRLAEYSTVQFLEATQVIGLCTNADTQPDTNHCNDKNLNASRVTGVHLRDRHHVNTTLQAQLIVDASGRNSQTPTWLQQLGYDMPQEEVVNSFLGYSTRMYASLGEGISNYKALYIMPKAPNHPRGSVIYQVEDGRWMVSLIGVGRDYPPTDEAGFLSFAQSLRGPEIYRAIKDGQPLSPIYGYRRTENCWRHYEHLSRSPENLVVIGDAVCAFNPVYGQGMTVAALGALTLKQCLQTHQQYPARNTVNFAQQFQRQLASVIRVAWLMATGDDFRWATTEGKPPSPITRLTQKYVDQVMQVASKNPEVYTVFLEVVHFLTPPTAFFQPNVVFPVFKSMLRSYPNQQVENEPVHCID